MIKVSNVPCLIVTLCKSPNFGAYLQAYALKEVLSVYGYQVSFLDVYGQANNYKRIRFLFKGWKKSPFSIAFNLRKMRSFYNAEKELNIVSRGEISRFDVAFIGSDEIWSVTNPTFTSAPEFFGLNLTNMLKFSYAPSVGSSVVADLACHQEYIKGIQSLDLVSVRDVESCEVATTAAQRKDVSLVLDPTFLHDFSRNEVEIPINKPYLLVYTYGLSLDIVSEIRAYADRRGLIVVSAGFHHSWVDRNLPCSPFEFLSVMREAECVITDTFHGSIFAIKYRKNFISYGGRKQKVKFLLESLGLEDCLVERGYLDNACYIKTDYENVDSKIKRSVDVSRKYLEKCNRIVLKSLYTAFRT